jgi:hypothetical protein
MHAGSSAAQCPSGLTDRADVVANPPTNDYDVYFTDDDPSSLDFFPASNAQAISDATLLTHNVFVGPDYEFPPPFFSVSPNDTCIYDILDAEGHAGGAAEARETRINSRFLRDEEEPELRRVVLHELFHHVEYARVG